MDFDFEMFVTAFAFSTTSVVLFTMLFIWVFLIHLIIQSNAVLDRHSSVLWRVLQYSPTIAFFGLFVYLSEDGFRLPIIIQMGFMLLYSHFAAKSVSALRGLENGDYINKATYEWLDEAVQVNAARRSIILTIACALFIGSHYLDDGVAAMLTVVGIAVLINAAIGYAERRYHRSVRKVSTGVFKQLAMAVFSLVVFVFSAFTTLYISEEPTLAMLVIGLLLFIQVQSFELLYNCDNKFHKHAIR